jgi:hypothetical protein
LDTFYQILRPQSSKSLPVAFRLGFCLGTPHPLSPSSLGERGIPGKTPRTSKMFTEERKQIVNNPPLNKV